MCLAFLLGGSLAGGYVRITINGAKLHWGSYPVAWKLQSAGSKDITDNSHVPAIEHAFQSWEDVTGSRVRFQYQGKTGSKNPSGPDHLVMFDENNGTGYFPAGSGVVALTPLSYDTGTGQILDADILFNGRAWQFSTDRTPGTFDVQDVLTHEIGHFIGLDHSPLLTASMWPYVSPNEWLHRSLSGDDMAGAIDVKGSGTHAVLKGSLRKSNGTDLKGAVVGAVRVSDGSTVATALSGSDGSWKIRGLPADDYYVYATPLEGAMDSVNLTSTWAIQTSFAAKLYGGYGSPTPFQVNAGQTKDCGSLTMPANGGTFDFTSTAYFFVPGQTQTVTLWGNGFSAGLMDVIELSPYLTVQSVNSGNTWVQAIITVDAACPTGRSFDLHLVGADGEKDVVVGVVEVKAPAPVIASLDATTGTSAGGTTVRLSGSGFQAGAYVLFGGREVASAAWIDASTCEVVTPSHGPATVDVSIHNPDGQQARLSSAYSFTADPQFTSLFPEAGQSSGGTEVMIQGASFAPDIEVFLDGTPLFVEWQSSSLLRVFTQAHAVGSAQLVLRNPLVPDAVVPDAFRFVPGPDPAISSFTPRKGKGGGGVLVKLQGSGLGDVQEVRFGVDPLSGQGGKAAASVTVKNALTVDAVAPSFSAGSYGIKVMTSTGQGVIAPATFQFLPAETGSGGSGGCIGVVGRSGPSGGTGDAPVFAALLLGYWLLRRRPPAAQGLELARAATPDARVRAARPQRRV